MVRCWHCKAESPDEHHARVVHGVCALYGPWSGWRLAGRELVSPDGDRLSPERLRGILFGERHRPRSRSKNETPPIGVLRSQRLLPPRERFEGAA